MSNQKIVESSKKCLVATISRAGLEGERITLGGPWDPYKSAKDVLSEVARRMRWSCLSLFFFCALHHDIFA